MKLIQEEKGNHVIIERDIVVNSMKIHIVSVFTGQTSMNEAIGRIITRKLAERKLKIR